MSKREKAPIDLREKGASIVNPAGGYPESHEVRISAGHVQLDGYLDIPRNAHGLVIFAHGSGSSRLSPRNKLTARELNGRGLGTLLFDLLTAREDAEDRVTAEHRFNVAMLAERLIGATDWVSKRAEVAGMRIGYFGASTGSAVALIAAAKRPGDVAAVVSRGGRPDLAGPLLSAVKAPTLLIVGGADHIVVKLNQEALAQIKAEKDLAIVPGATHLFEEPGAIETVAALAGDWFLKYLGQPHAR